MPSQPANGTLKVNSCFRTELVWDVELSITDADLNVKQDLEGGSTALPGNWSLSVVHTSGGVAFSLGYSGMLAGALGTGVKTRGTLDWVVEDVTGCLAAQSWEEETADWTAAAERSGGKYVPTSRQTYRFTVFLERDFPKKGEDMVDEVTGKLAQRVSGLNLEQAPHDVRFYFPRPQQPDGTELWARSDFLSRSSPYFDTLLSSDFAESVPRRSKRARKSSVTSVEAPLPTWTTDRDFNDSDDETDTFLFSNHPPKANVSDSEDLSYRQITVTQTAYSTYHALLVFLQTGFVDFIPLSSSFDNAESRTSFLSNAHDMHPHLPLPVSPASLYRLAHLLSLYDLQKRALDCLPSSLSVENAGIELFSETSITYDDWRKIIVVWIKAHWTEVKASEQWKEKMRAIKSGEGGNGVGAVMVELMEAGLSM